MKKLILIFSSILLLANGTGAMYGGIMLVADPTGTRLQMPLTYLEHSPFSNYLIPGIILLIVNGLFSFIALTTLFLKQGQSYLFVIIQGLLLSGWIIIQIILLRIFYAPMHGTFLFIGLCLIGCGVYLKKNV